MTQAWNLSQLANKVNTSGQLDAGTGLVNSVPVANGGTNNASLGVVAGGIYYGDGSKIVETSAGTSGQFLQSNGAGAPTWGSPSGGVTSLNGQTGAITNTSYGVIGSYVPAYGVAATNYNPGDTTAGSNLVRQSATAFGGFNASNASSNTANSTLYTQPISILYTSLSLSGTWRCMTQGGTTAPGASVRQFHLWVRIS